MSQIDEAVLGWIYKNKIRNERGEVLEFEDHYFLIEPFADWHWKQCAMKSAQIGWSTLAILKTIYAAAYRNYNCIYALPSYDDVTDFVPVKVDGIVANNPFIKTLIKSSDAISKKQIANNFIWYRGTHSRSAAIMHTSDLNIVDEYDACDLATVDMYTSRLQKSTYKGEWFFSNPTYPGGINDKYDQSDQRRYHITCTRCNQKQVLDYWKNVCKERKIYVCQNCDQELRAEDRRVGEWVATYPEREMHGYHISQLMAPWVSAKELIYLEDTKSPNYFYNMVLGLPYVEKDQTVDRELIKKNLIMKENSQIRNALGIDVQARRLHYVLGNHEGIFKVGTITGEDMWDQVIGMIKRYNPITVVDQAPDPYPRRKLVPMFPGRVYTCVYRQNSQRRDLVEWGTNDNRGNVYVDRNRLISAMVYDWGSGDIKINTNGKNPHYFMQNDLDEYVKHWENIYRVLHEDNFGITKSEWKKSAADDYVHATGYFRVALSKVPKLEPWEESESEGIEIIADSIQVNKKYLLAENKAKYTDDWLY